MKIILTIPNNEAAHVATVLSAAAGISDRVADDRIAIEDALDAMIDAHVNNDARRAAHDDVARLAREQAAEAAAEVRKAARIARRTARATEPPPA